MRNKNSLNDHPDFLNFTYDRTAAFHNAANDLFERINDFTNQHDLVEFYKYFETSYGLPQGVTKKKLRQHLGRSYIFKKQEFKSRLRLRNIPRYIALYGGLIYALFFTSRCGGKKTYSLIIDSLQHPIELSRFEKLINLFGRKHVLCVSFERQLSAEFPNYNVIDTKLFRKFLLSDLVRAIFNEIAVGLWVVLKVSLKSRVNLFPIALQIIHSYLSYNSLFQSNTAKYMIQERHYDTNAVKNYLFKKHGGIAALTIQKNIFQNDPINWYMDIDILFSLGQAGYEDMLRYGGTARSVMPVGSMFMEVLWFDKKIVTETVFDLVILGINTANEYDRLDSFNEFMEDYYSVAHWCAKLSIERPNFKVALIHHSSLKKDLIEEGILKGSNVEVLDSTLNSYQIAFSSKCAVTYGSTMGYELNAHGLDTFFIDPGYRCTFLPQKGNALIDKMRITSYGEFARVIDEVVTRDRKFVPDSESEAWMMESSDVSQKIYNILSKQSV